MLLQTGSHQTGSPATHTQSDIDLNQLKSLCVVAVLSAAAVAQRISHMLKLHAAPIAVARAFVPHENQRACDANHRIDDGLFDNDKRDLFFFNDIVFGDVDFCDGPSHWRRVGNFHLHHFQHEDVLPF